VSAVLVRMLPARASVLPGTDGALSPRRMAPALRRAAGAPETAACHVLDAKWQGPDRATVLYAVGDRLVSLHRDGARTSLACFPDDPALPTLARVLDPAVAAGLLRAASGPGGGAPASRRCRVELLRYRPGKRATVLLRPRPSGASGPSAGDVVAKVYDDAGKAAAVAAEASALAGAVPPGAGLALAPARGSVPALSVVLQGRVAGHVLDDVLGGPWEAAADGVERAARALAVLHGLPAVTSRRRPVDRELDRFAARAATARAVAPDAAAALGRLADRLVATGELLPPGTVGVVHGDCKPSQFLCRPGDVVLLDLDHCGLADPAGDVGTFLASLRQRAEREATSRHRHRIGRARLDALAGRFRSVYHSCHGRAVPERILWYEAVALERKALRALARAPRSPLPALLARAAHERLDELTGDRQCS
jgi:hypothetical protein